MATGFPKASEEEIKRATDASGPDGIHGLGPDQNTEAGSTGVFGEGGGLHVAGRNLAEQAEGFGLAVQDITKDYDKSKGWYTEQDRLEDKVQMTNYAKRRAKTSLMEGNLGTAGQVANFGGQVLPHIALGMATGGTSGLISSTVAGGMQATGDVIADQVVRGQEIDSEAALKAGIKDAAFSAVAGKYIPKFVGDSTAIKRIGGESVSGAVQGFGSNEIFNEATGREFGENAGMATLLGGGIQGTFRAVPELKNADWANYKPLQSAANSATKVFSGNVDIPESMGKNLREEIIAKAGADVVATKHSQGNNSDGRSVDEVAAMVHDSVAQGNGYSSAVRIMEEMEAKGLAGSDALLGIKMPDGRMLGEHMGMDAKEVNKKVNTDRSLLDNAVKGSVLGKDATDTSAKHQDDIKKSLDKTEKRIFTKFDEAEASANRNVDNLEIENAKPGSEVPRDKLIRARNLAKELREFKKLIKESVGSTKPLDINAESIKDTSHNIVRLMVENGEYGNIKTEQGDSWTPYGALKELDISDKIATQLFPAVRQSITDPHKGSKSSDAGVFSMAAAMGEPITGLGLIGAKDVGKKIGRVRANRAKKRGSKLIQELASLQPKSLNKAMASDSAAKLNASGIETGFIPENKVQLTMEGNTQPVDSPVAEPVQSNEKVVSEPTERSAPNNQITPPKDIGDDIGRDIDSLISSSADDMDSNIETIKGKAEQVVGSDVVEELASLEGSLKGEELNTLIDKAKKAAIDVVGTDVDADTFNTKEHSDKLDKAEADAELVVRAVNDRLPSSTPDPITPTTDTKEVSSPEKAEEAPEPVVKDVLPPSTPEPITPAVDYNKEISLIPDKDMRNAIAYKGDYFANNLNHNYPDIEIGELKKRTQAAIQELRTGSGKLSVNDINQQEVKQIIDNQIALENKQNKANGEEAAKKIVKVARTPEQLLKSLEDDASILEYDTDTLKEAKKRANVTDDNITEAGKKKVLDEAPGVIKDNIARDLGPNRILDSQPNATEAQIEAAYKKAFLKPGDKLDDKSFKAVFTELNKIVPAEAKANLKDIDATKTADEKAAKAQINSAHDAAIIHEDKVKASAKKDREAELKSFDKKQDSKIKAKQDQVDKAHTAAIAAEDKAVRAKNASDKKADDVALKAASVKAREEAVAAKKLVDDKADEVAAAQRQKDNARTEADKVEKSLKDKYDKEVKSRKDMNKDELDNLLKLYGKDEAAAKKAQESLVEKISDTEDKIKSKKLTLDEALAEQSLASGDNKKYDQPKIDRLTGEVKILEGSLERRKASLKKAIQNEDSAKISQDIILSGDIANYKRMDDADSRNDLLNKLEEETGTPRPQLEAILATLEAKGKYHELDYSDQGLYSDISKKIKGMATATAKASTAKVDATVEKAADTVKDMKANEQEQVVEALQTEKLDAIKSGDSDKAAELDAAQTEIRRLNKKVHGYQYREISKVYNDYAEDAAQAYRDGYPTELLLSSDSKFKMGKIAEETVKSTGTGKWHNGLRNEVYGLETVMPLYNDKLIKQLRKDWDDGNYTPTTEAMEMRSKIPHNRHDFIEPVRGRNVTPETTQQSSSAVSNAGTKTPDGKWIVMADGSFHAIDEGAAAKSASDIDAGNKAQDILDKIEKKTPTKQEDPTVAKEQPVTRKAALNADGEDPRGKRMTEADIKNDPELEDPKFRDDQGFRATNADGFIIATNKEKRDGLAKAQAEGKTEVIKEGIKGGKIVNNAAKKPAKGKGTGKGPGKKRRLAGGALDDFKAEQAAEAPVEAGPAVLTGARKDQYDNSLIKAGKGTATADELSFIKRQDPEMFKAIMATPGSGVTSEKGSDFDFMNDASKLKHIEKKIGQLRKWHGKDMVDSASDKTDRLFQSEIDWYNKNQPEKADTILESFHNPYNTDGELITSLDVADTPDFNGGLGKAIKGDGKETAQHVLNRLSESGLENPNNQALVNRLMANIDPATKFKVVETNDGNINPKQDADSVLGSFSPVDNIVYLKKDSLLPDIAKKQNVKSGEETFIHELVHSTTTYILKNVIHGKNGGGTKAQKAAVSRMEELMKVAKDKNNDANIDGVGKAAFTNVEEFITYAMTNPNFQKLLSGIKSPGKGGQSKKNLFTKVTEQIMSALGLKGEKGRTALEEAIKTGEDFMDAQTSKRPKAALTKATTGGSGEMSVGPTESTVTKPALSQETDSYGDVVDDDYSKDNAGVDEGKIVTVSESNGDDVKIDQSGPVKVDTVKADELPPAAVKDLETKIKEGRAGFLRKNGAGNKDVDGEYLEDYTPQEYWVGLNKGLKVKEELIPEEGAIKPTYDGKLVNKKGASGNDANQHVDADGKQITDPGVTPPKEDLRKVTKKKKVVKKKTKAEKLAEAEKLAADDVDYANLDDF